MFHRTCYLQKFKRLSPLSSQMIDGNLFDLQLKFIDACISQDRDTPALNYLRLCKQISYQRGNESKLAWILRYSKVYHKSSGFHGNLLSLDDSEDILKGMSNSIVLLTKFVVTDEIPSLMRWEYLLGLGDSYWSMANICQSHWDALASGSAIKGVLKVFINHGFAYLTGHLNQATSLTAGTSKEAMVAHLSNKSFDILQKTIPMYLEACYDDNVQQVSTALMVLSDFCDDQMGTFENRNNFV